MPLIKPFAALRPTAGHAGDVAAPPYDVISAAEARRMVVDRPWSFLHVSRAEVDLPADSDPYAPAVYAKSRENLERMRRAGILRADPVAGYYLYRMSSGHHSQTGLVGVASLAAYASHRIKRHELTRPRKEDDRVRQIEALAAQTGPVLLAYRARPELDDLIARLAADTVPESEVTTADGVSHALWPVFDHDQMATLTHALEALPALYIADGHHRCAAAARVAQQRRQANPSDTGAEPYHFVLSVLFSHEQMRILDYNRVVRDLHGLDVATFIRRISVIFDIVGAPGPVRPTRAGEFGMYLAGHWYRLTLPPERIPFDDPVGRLDVSLLQDHLIGPILGIQDPRSDERIDFVGGVRGLEALAQRVETGEMAVAFSLFPTAMDALMAVADAGELMPPKSTWFEPKLADGLVSHLFDAPRQDP
ncbi:hypothetical protein CKO25_00260 [Thiocapsa imhoffii]|uniref:DUF1015 domain-containing protein n=1 Tax=Thiocapsa imhoffii TaxID=382777 RepID=A0A9X1B6Y1_9GAMM|nr:DUF1015 family protein [Thiocapsa imhoffii]MBK1643112.1 hypothetical protein [Thiocapsa imhoffii]